MNTSFDEDDDHEQPMNTAFDVDDDHEQMLTLSLSIGSRSSTPPPVSPIVQLQPTFITTSQPSLSEPIFWMPPRPPPLSPSPSPPPSYLSWMPQPPSPPPSYLFMPNPHVSCQVGMPELSNQVEALELSCQVEAPEPLLPSYHIVSNSPVSPQVEAQELSCQVEAPEPLQPSYHIVSNPPVLPQVEAPELSCQVEAQKLLLPSYHILSNPLVSPQVQVPELSCQVEAPELLSPSYHILSNPHVSRQVEVPELSCQLEAPEPPPPSYPSYLFMSNPPAAPVAASISCPGRARKHPAHAFKSGKSEALPAPYRWAKTLRASVHRFDYLLSKGISRITGKLYCKRCDKQYVVKYDLRQKFSEVASFVLMNKAAMNDRAPDIWMYPNLPNCQYCDQNINVRPAHSKKRSINWLFLFLGQMLGCCKLSELKYFCKHTKNHRTGAKDRVLYLTYLDLCKQLDPNIFK